MTCYATDPGDNPLRVQLLVPAQAAGILFTADPLTASGTGP
ncbi:MAG TPA: hypothetical protein VK923_12840 [Euzebyales bacterium]|nr:hypothetical protein [Euzebyales bacterium]